MTRNDSQALLRSIFGYQSFRPHQEEIISNAVSGRDVLVVMPTGGGKSLCYQIPGIARPGMAIVVSPLIALMRDQVAALKQAGVSAEFLNSSLSSDEARAIRSRIANGDVKVLYLAPERLLSEGFADFLARIPIALFAVDEAHCVSQWGHDFRPEYMELAKIAALFPDVPRIALTATADRSTRDEIVNRLELRDPEIFVTGFDRPNIKYYVRQKNTPRQQLLQFLKKRSSLDSGIVYALSRKKTEEIAAFLASHGFHAKAYHAGLSTDDRNAVQDEFLRGEGMVVVATVAFGMGIDKPDVRFVFHFDLPKSIEAYYQETGRAGRDGLPSDAYLVYGFEDMVLLRHMISAGESDENRKRVEYGKLQSLLGYCETVRCRREVLIGYFGETFRGPCGNCDTCLEPVETWDGTRECQLALSTVFRTGQRFGAQHLIAILRGDESEKIQQFGHDRISTFSMGQHLTQKEWSSVFRQLGAAGYIGVDYNGYGGLFLTAESRKVLRGEETVQLRRDPAPTVRSRKDSKRPSETVNDRLEPLLRALKQKRRQLAEEQRVPAYVIFHDKTLIEMAEREPKNLTDLSRISGIGEAKLERYGETFLDVLRSFGEE